MASDRALEAYEHQFDHLVPGLEEQVEWRNAEDSCLQVLVEAREDVLLLQQNTVEDEDVIAAIAAINTKCDTIEGDLKFIQTLPEQRIARERWCGLGIDIVPTSESFFVVQVADARVVESQHDIHYDPPIAVHDEVMAINGISTLLLSSVEVQ